MLFHRIMDYLGRYRLIMDRTGNKPYLARYYLFLMNRSRFPFNIFLHKFLLSDPYDLHDHPWAYISIPLWPGYWEHTPKPTQPPTPVDINDISHYVEDHHLTIQKIMDIPSNTPTEIAFFDRNYIDFASNNPVGIPIPAREALRHRYRGIFTRAQDTIEGTMIWSWDGDNEEHEEDWEWDILIDNERWYPLKYINNDELDYPQWRKLDPNTKLGWRGPSVLDSDIGSFPPIIINDNDTVIVNHNVKIPCDGTHKTWRSPLSIRYRSAESLHRIELDPRGYCWTLFIPMIQRRAWGFQTAMGWVPEDNYLSEKKSDK